MSGLTPISPYQRAVATAKAAESRQRRAEVKRRLRDGSLTFHEVFALAEREESLARLRVSEILQTLPNIGVVRSAKIMDELRIAANRRLQGLGVHQRTALLDYLGSSTSERS